jgi:hypothetical protein
VRYFYYDVNDLLFSFAVFAVILRLRASKRESFCGLARFRRCIFPALSAVSANAATGDPSRSLVGLGMLDLISRDRRHMCRVDPYRLQAGRAAAIRPLVATAQGIEGISL